MDESASDAALSLHLMIQQRPNRPRGNARQPVSCEPCRRRKIKCSRTRPPCDTCRRRRCADNCVYKSSRHEDVANGINEDLVHRISNLESLLKKHAGTQSPHGAEGLAGPLLSPPMEQHDLLFQESPNTGSFVSESPSQNSQFSEPASARGVGVLTTEPNANVRYEARSAQWTSVLANTSLSNLVPSLDDQDDSATASGFPFTSLPMSSMDELLTLLPPLQLCEYLKDKYFAVFSPLFHILHDPTFHAQYVKFVDNPSRVSISWLAILFVLLSLAVTALEDTDPILRDLGRGPNAHSNVQLLSRRYREAAQKCLAKQGVLWGKHNIQTLQALILLLYSMSHSQDHTWVILGMTYNVAIALACHIDPQGFNLDPIQCEERRRCWAGLRMQYTIQNTFLGNPDPSWRISHEVRLPADVDDKDITLSGIQESFTGPTQMSYLLFKFQLYDLSAKICQETCTSSEPSRSTIQELDSQICSVQERWEKRYLTDSAPDALRTHHAVHLHILHAYSHQLFLLLHRPFFARSVIGLDVPNESQIRCIASAEALLDIHRILSETPRFRPYMWYTTGLGSFHAFHAAAVLAVVLLMPIYKPQYQRFRRTLDDILARFETFAGRSKICEKSARVLRFLLETPSPNQTPSIDSLLNTPENDSSKNDWLGTHQMKFFAERLEPQQWLGPASMDWTEWDNFIIHMSGA